MSRPEVFGLALSWVLLLISMVIGILALNKKINRWASGPERPEDPRIAQPEVWRLIDRLDPSVRDVRSGFGMGHLLLVPLMNVMMNRIEALETEVATLKGK